MHAEAQQPQDLGRRLSELASQLGEVASAVTALEQRQRERDQTVQSVLAQFELLSSNLRTVVPPAPPEASTEPEAAAASSTASAAPSVSEEPPASDTPPHRQW